MKKIFMKKTLIFSSLALAVSLPLSTTISCTSSNALSDVQSVKAARTELFTRTRGTIVSSLRASQIDDIIKNETQLSPKNVDIVLGFAPEDDYLDLSITTINTYGASISYSFNATNTKSGKEGKRYELVAKISKGSSVSLNFPIPIHSHDYVEWTNPDSIDDVKKATDDIKEALAVALETDISIVNPGNGFFRSNMINNAIIKGDVADPTDDLSFDDKGKVVVYKGNLEDIGLRTGIDFMMPNLPSGVFATYQIVDNHNYDIDTDPESGTATYGVKNDDEPEYADEADIANSGERYVINVEIGKRGAVSDRSISLNIESADYYSKAQNIANHRINAVYDFLSKNCLNAANKVRTSVSSSIAYMKGQNSMLTPTNWSPYDGLTPDINVYGLNQWANGPYRHTPESAPGLPNGVSVLMTFRKETPGRIDGAQYELVFEISAPNGTTNRNAYFYFRTSDWRENN